MTCGKFDTAEQTSHEAEHLLACSINLEHNVNLSNEISLIFNS